MAGEDLMQFSCSIGAKRPGTLEKSIDTDVSLGKQVSRNSCEKATASKGSTGVGV